MKSSVLALALFLACSQAYSEISESDFKATLDSFREIYSPKIEADLGISLHFESFWTRRSMIVSSQARKVDNEAIVFIDGEIARKPETNLSAFALSVCHEFGHIYNDVLGELKITREGNADYWAAGCAIGFFSKVQFERTGTVPAFLESKCQEIWPSSYETCMQVATGINAYAKLYKINIENGIDASQNDLVANSFLHPLAFIAGLFGEAKPSCISRIRMAEELTNPRPIPLTNTFHKIERYIVYLQMPI